jgi:hypothetical protein
MAFDTKAPTPKVLFSPVGAVPDEDLDAIARQAKSPAAEAAIKLNVYQMDESTAPASAQPETVEEEEAAPVKRESKAAGEKASDVSDIVKKWSKK